MKKIYIAHYPADKRKFDAKVAFYNKEAAEKMLSMFLAGATGISPIHLVEEMNVYESCEEIQEINKKESLEK